MGQKKTRMLYKLLGVDESANIEEIKKAYKKIAHLQHPDKNQGITDNQFIEITKAYKILSDPKRKAEYDDSGYSQEPISDNNEIAIEILQSWVKQTLDTEEGFTTHILNLIKNRCKLNMEQCELRKLSQKRKLLLIQRVAKNLEKKSRTKHIQTVDVLQIAIFEEEEICRFLIKQADYEKEITKLIVEILDDYTYVSPTKEEVDKFNEENPKPKSQPLGNIFEMARGIR